MFTHVVCYLIARMRRTHLTPHLLFSILNGFARFTKLTCPCSATAATRAVALGASQGIRAIDWPHADKDDSCLRILGRYRSFNEQYRIDLYGKLFRLSFCGGSNLIVRWDTNRVLSSFQEWSGDAEKRQWTSVYTGKKSRHSGRFVSTLHLNANCNVLGMPKMCPLITMNLCHLKIHCLMWWCIKIFDVWMW